MVFFCGLTVSLILALAAPSWGATGGPLRSEILTPWAVGLIFLIQGLQLPGREVWKGMSVWKVHLFCQGWMFGIFPLLGLLFIALLGDRLDAAGRTGLIFLCVLPTTIATNAAFAARAGGNTAVALFNIVIGNVAGIFIAPFVLAWLLQQNAQAPVEFLPLLRTILLQLILPFALGQILRLRFSVWIDGRKGWLRETASVLIFFIIYGAVCNFMMKGRGVGSLPEWAALSGLVLMLLFLQKALCWAALKWTGWPVDLRISAFYCASQKTLAAGLPMAGAVWESAGPGADLPPLAPVLLPFVVYHTAQLVVGALLIPGFARQAAEAKAGQGSVLRVTRN